MPLCECSSCMYVYKCWTYLIINDGFMFGFRCGSTRKDIYIYKRTVYIPVSITNVCMQLSMLEKEAYIYMYYIWSKKQPLSIYYIWSKNTPLYRINMIEKHSRLLSEVCAIDEFWMGPLLEKKCDLATRTKKALHALETLWFSRGVHYYWFKGNKEGKKEIKKRRKDDWLVVFVWSATRTPPLCRYHLLHPL